MNMNHIIDQGPFLILAAGKFRINLWSIPPDFSLPEFLSYFYVIVYIYFESYLIIITEQDRVKLTTNHSPFGGHLGCWQFLLLQY